MDIRMEIAQKITSLSRVIKRSLRQKLGSQHKGTGRAVVLPAAYISWAIKLTLGPHTCIPARHIYWRSRKLMLAYEQLLSSVNHCRTSLEAYCLPFISQASRNPLPSSARCLAIKSKCCLLGRGLLHKARVEDRPLHYEVQNMVGEYTIWSQFAMNLLQRFDLILFPFLEKKS